MKDSRIVKMIMLSFKVQVVPLTEGIKNNYSNISKLRCQRDSAFFEKLDEIYSIIHDKPYDINQLIGLKAFRSMCRKSKTFWLAKSVHLYMSNGSFNKIYRTIISPEQFSTMVRTVYLKLYC